MVIADVGLMACLIVMALIAGFGYGWVAHAASYRRQMDDMKFNLRFLADRLVEEQEKRKFNSDEIK
jgi:uncharacterized membrane-anchored protein YhcB (DUF1043 family)